MQSCCSKWLIIVNVDCRWMLYCWWGNITSQCQCQCQFQSTYANANANADSWFLIPKIDHGGGPHFHILIIIHLIGLRTHHLLLLAILGIQHHFWMMMIFVSTRFHIDSTAPPTPAGDMLVPSVDCRIIYIQCNFYFHQMMKTRANGDVDRKGILSLTW